MGGTAWVFVTRAAEQVEQSSGVSISRFAEEPSASQGTIIFSVCPPSPPAETAVSHQRGCGDDAVCRGGIRCFHPAERLLRARQTCGPFPRPGLKFTLQVWSLQPRTAPQRRDGSSEAPIWKTLKDESDGRPRPPRLGRDFSWSLGESRSDHGKFLWSEPRSAFTAVAMKSALCVCVYVIYLLNSLLYHHGKCYKLTIKPLLQVREELILCTAVISSVCCIYPLAWDLGCILSQNCFVVFGFFLFGFVGFFSPSVMPLTT